MKVEVTGFSVEDGLMKIQVALTVPVVSSKGGGGGGGGTTNWVTQDGKNVVTQDGDNVVART